MATDRGLVGSRQRGRELRRLRPRPPLRGPATRPASTPHERVKVLDAEGIDISVMYPGLGLKLGGIQDPRPRGGVVRGLQRLGRRVVLASPRPAQGRRRAPDAGSRRGRATRRAASATSDLVAGFARPNAYNDRPFHHPSYTPVWEALEETGLPLGLHIAGLADMPGASRRCVHLMAPGTHHALIPVIDQHDDALEPRLRRRARAASRAQGRGARERRRLDRALDGPARRVRRELRLGGGADVARRRASTSSGSAGSASIPASARRPRSGRSSASTASSGRPTSRTATRSTPAWSTSCASTTATLPDDARRASSGSTRSPCTASPSRPPEHDVRPPDPRRHRRRRHRRAGAHRRRRRRATARSSTIGRVDGTRRRRRSTPTACSSRPASSTSTRTTTRSSHWDPTASPASWHGVTTLLTGNCGFTLAPSRARGPRLAAARCSAGSRACRPTRSRPGSTFRGGSLGDFLADLDGRIGVNVGANVGHCAVRRYVMGDDASERTATDDEIAADA